MPILYMVARENLTSCALVCGKTTRPFFGKPKDREKTRCKNVSMLVLVMKCHDVFFF